MEKTFFQSITEVFVSNEPFISCVADAVTKKLEQKPRCDGQPPDNGSLLPDMLSANEACRIFCPAIARSTLHKYVKAGLFSRYHVGKRAFYSRTEILAKVKSIKNFKMQKNGQSTNQ